MEYGGIFIVAVLGVVISLIPYLVTRRTAIAQSREIDRFSPQMRLLNTSHPHTEESCTTGHGILLNGTRPVHSHNGGLMAHEKGSPQSAQFSRVHVVREIARLRAERAARLSREAAGGQRRMIVTFICAALTVILGISTVLGSLAWAWALAGTLPLVGALTWSRVAAMRSERRNQAEITRLRELRDQASHEVTAEPHAYTINGSVTNVSTEQIKETSQSTARTIDEVVTRTSQTHTGKTGINQYDENETKESSDAAPAIARQSEEETGAATTSGMTWSVTPIPAPTYATRSRVAGRMVHVDTDMRGIPQVSARVPVRPVAIGQVSAPTQTTEEVVADQAVRLDLEAVLEARRAQ
ncbi:hypothetical protein [Schaalia sp. lx-260]|uniref:hypothetical protein n=1 Tax=Schaalia sp. lx-260 TaxID=2899082 RepID=UPI001E5051DD|nr:hypothetical protein [Schaalia sp. lx-260]MCD4549014.1 hypothetical protein [Schaalia sp. lx-260]